MASQTLNTSRSDIRQRFIDALELRQRDSILGIQDDVFPIIEQYTGGAEAALEQLAEIICSEFTVEGGLKINATTVWGALLNARWLKFSEATEVTHSLQSGASQNMSLACIKHDRLLGHFALQNGEYTIGRALDNHVHLRDETVSRHHATLLPSASGFRLINRNEANGTLLNSQRIEDDDIKEGDVIRIGQHRLMLVPTSACHEARLHEIAMPKAIDADDMDAAFAEMKAEQPSAPPEKGVRSTDIPVPAAIQPPLYETEADPIATADPLISAPEIIDDMLAPSSDEHLRAEPSLNDETPPDVQIITSSASRSLISPMTMGIGVVALLAGSIYGISKLPTNAGSTIATTEIATQEILAPTLSAQPPTKDMAQLPSIQAEPHSQTALINLDTERAETVVASNNAQPAVTRNVAPTISPPLERNSLAAQLESTQDRHISITNPAAMPPEPTYSTISEGPITTYGIDTFATFSSTIYRDPQPTISGDALQNDLSGLLRQGRQQMSQLKLTTPAGDNALASYQQILAIAPAHPEAVAGLRQIANNYLRLAELSQQKNQLIHAREMVRRGLSVDPSHSNLQNLQYALENQKHSGTGQITDTQPNTISLNSAASLTPSTIPMATMIPESPRNQASLFDDKPIPANLVEQPASASKSLSEMTGSGLTASEEFTRIPMPSTAASSPMLSKPVKLNVSVEELLLQAERQALFRQITTPVGDNAVETYRKILRISPMHPQALRGLQRIASRYYARAKLFEETNYLAEAISAAQKGLEVSPSHNELQQLKSHLKWRLSGQ